MYFCLDPALLGAALDVFEAVDVAGELGYAGVSLECRRVCALPRGDLDALLERFKARKLVMGPWSISFDWRRGDGDFLAGLKDFHDAARTMARFGPSTATTWVAPFSVELDWNENLKLHARRLRQIAEALGSAGDGLRLALEFMGCRKLRQGFRHEFVHNLRGLAQLVQKTRADHVGMVLDAWSVYASGRDLASLDFAEDAEIMVVQLGDAPRDVPPAELDDENRYLPGECGAIDCGVLAAGLAQRGYAGPLVVEACAGSLSALDSVGRARAAMKCLWEVTTATVGQT